MSFAEFSLRLFSCLMFLRFRQCSPDGGHQTLLESGFQDVILCPLCEDFDSTIFTDSAGY